MIVCVQVYAINPHQSPDAIHHPSSYLCISSVVKQVMTDHLHLVGAVVIWYDMILKLLSSCLRRMRQSLILV